MFIYTPILTPRLQYIIDFFASQISNEKWILTSDESVLTSSVSPVINYSNLRPSEKYISILPHGLLFENDIKDQIISCRGTIDFPVFFQNESVLGFDILAASFYLISRYEEYLPHKTDIHGRYMHENSVAYKNNFLHLPLINIWINHFKKLLKKYYPEYIFKETKFTFIPTYDIDMAWSYKNKNFIINGGNLLKEISTLNFKAASKRINVLTNKQQDPFYNFHWLDALHKKHNLSPVYFFLVGQKHGKYDKNVLPKNIAMQNLINNISKKYKIGLHPSYISNNNINILKNELDILNQITGQNVICSRQHYLKFTLPGTYNNLLEIGIKEDYSMAYSSINGFRASFAGTFFWYDLTNNKPTNLLLYPACYMETNSFYNKDFSPQQALTDLKNLFEIVKKYNGAFISIWHNSSLGETNEPYNWRNTYEIFIKMVSE